MEKWSINPKKWAIYSINQTIIEVATSIHPTKSSPTPPPCKKDGISPPYHIQNIILKEKLNGFLRFNGNLAALHDEKLCWHVDDRVGYRFSV